MKKVKYLGGETNLGRFGMIEKGAVLELYEYEWDSVCEDSKFRLIPEPHTEEAVAKARAALPAKGKSYALTVIQWDNKRLYGILNARYPRQQCVQILTAMKEAGCIVRDFNEHTTRSSLADFIVEAARHSGWGCSSAKTSDTAPIAKAVRKRAARLET